MKVLDLFCGAGGAAMGYHRAGFEVVGVDNRPQPQYPFSFVQADALEYLESLSSFSTTTESDGENEFDFIHASPPCQDASKTWFIQGREHRSLIGGVRKLLRSRGTPYVIENVPGAPLRNPITLCGSSFGLPLKRHRIFESNVDLEELPCAHGDLPYRWTLHVSQGCRAVRTRFVYVYGHGQSGQTIADWKEAMGIDWMTRNSLAQAIPPAFTEFIGRQIAASLALEEVA